MSTCIWWSVRAMVSVLMSTYICISLKMCSFFFVGSSASSNVCFHSCYDAIQCVPLPLTIYVLRVMSCVLLVGSKYTRCYEALYDYSWFLICIAVISGLISYHCVTDCT